ncbi:hypothetical protein AYI69_g2058 [Smittium culicis]|uniref:UspA domain-containing protein n=1 Tax=Smittium culicis TaxID=133412 RepID=A0A1R1YNL7_9FUNG|nr:hypothetical protein AYI69_g2058 [Smittium culicis]
MGNSAVPSTTEAEILESVTGVTSDERETKINMGGMNLMNYKISGGQSGYGEEAAAVGSGDGHDIRRVVMVCVSGSKTSSEQVVDKSVKMVLNKNSDLVILLHVRKSNENCGYTGQDEFIPGQADMNNTFKAESYEILTNYGNKLKNLGYVIRAISVAGDDPGSEIAKKVSELSIDLLVVGKPEKSGISYFLSGNSCEKLFKQCDCTITLIKIDQ